MKRIATIITLMTAATLFSALTLMADENNSFSYEDEYADMIKPKVQNECLLLAKNCENDPVSIHERVYVLRKEISKGLGVYTPTELRTMEEELKWIESDSTNEIQ